MDRIIIGARCTDHAAGASCACGTIVLDYPGGISARVFCSPLSDRKERRISIYGERGALFFDMQAPEPLRLLAYSPSGFGFRQDEASGWSTDEANNLALVLKDFAEAIRSGDASQNLAIARNVLQVLQWLERRL